MELGSHPDLESIPNDLASISELVGSALKGASAPALSNQQEDPGCSSVESNKALRRLLLKQMPAVEVSVWPGRLVEAVVSVRPLCRGSQKARLLKPDAQSFVYHTCVLCAACSPGLLVASIAASRTATGYVFKSSMSPAV